MRNMNKRPISYLIEDRGPMEPTSLSPFNDDQDFSLKRTRRPISSLIEEKICSLRGPIKSLAVRAYKWGPSFQLEKDQKAKREEKLLSNRIRRPSPLEDQEYSLGGSKGPKGPFKKDAQIINIKSKSTHTFPPRGLRCFFKKIDKSSHRDSKHPLIEDK